MEPTEEKLKTDPAHDSLREPTKLHKLKEWIKSNPKKAALAAAGIVAVIAASGVLGWMYFNKQPAESVAETRQEVPEPKTLPSPLTGLEVKPELAKRPVRGVVIENSPEARPQSGLSQAGVVYESVSEGGITRYLALFLDEKPPVIGPVRSLRLFFMSWAREFGAPISHVGGNASAIDNIRAVGITSLNQFYNGNSYYRASDRFAPHNVYTTTKLLDQLYKQRGLYKASNFTPSPRKDDEPPADSKTVPHKRINVNFSYGGYNVRWDYNLASNAYKRFLAGAADKDRNNGKQITVKNVIVIHMPTSYGTSRNGEKMTVMKTVGSGKAVVFRDGKATVGTWKKTAHSERTQLLDSTGEVIKLNKGHSWYCVIPQDTGSLKY